MATIQIGGDIQRAFHTIRFWAFELLCIAGLTLWVLLWQPAWANKGWAMTAYQVFVPLAGVFAGFALLYLFVAVVAGARQSIRLVATNIAIEVSQALTQDVANVVSEASQPLTQEQIAERLSFIQKLRAVADQLVKNVHYNIVGSVAHIFNKFWEEPDARGFREQDDMAGLAIRLMIERFHTLTFSSLKIQGQASDLIPSTLTDFDIQRHCTDVLQAVIEYRHMTEEFLNFTDTLAEKGVPSFWNKAPWSITIHKNLADDYDELMRLVKDLRIAAPKGFQQSLPGDEQTTTFPRKTMWS